MGVLEEGIVAGDVAVVERHQVDVVGDMGVDRMADADLLAERFLDLLAKQLEAAAVFGRDLDVGPVPVDDGEEIAAEGDIGLHFTNVRNLERHVFFGDERRHVLELDPVDRVIADRDFRVDDAGGGLHAELGQGLLGRHQALRDHRRAEADGAVAAAVEPARAAHPDHAAIGIVRRGRRQEHAEHVLVAAWLHHQRAPHPVIVLLKELALADDVEAGGIAHARMHDAERTA